jgi:hypothetical protein
MKLPSLLTVLATAGTLLDHSGQVQGHGIGTGYCLGTNGAIRVWVRHWHGAISSLGGEFFQVSQDGGAVENLQPSGFVNNLGVQDGTIDWVAQDCVSGAFGGQSLPTEAGGTFVSTGECPGNSQDDWVYFDFFGSGFCNGDSFSITLVGSPGAILDEACTSLYPTTVNAVISVTGPPYVEIDGNNVCGTSVYVPTNTPVVYIVVDACDPNPTTNSEYYLSGEEFPAAGTITNCVDAVNSFGNQQTCCFDMIIYDDSVPTLIPTTPGACVFEGNCVRSHAGATPGGSDYANDALCEFQYLGPDQLIDVVFFDTESCCDFLVIDGTSYSGSNEITVNSGDVFRWTSDGSVTRAGWEICLVPPPSPSAQPSGQPSLLPSGAPSMAPSSLCVTPPVLCPTDISRSRTTTDVEEVSGKGGRRDLRISKASSAGVDEPLFPVCLQLEGGKRGRGSVETDSEYRTECVDFDVYLELEAGLPKAAGKDQINDYYCGCCNTGDEEYIPLFCLGPPICEGDQAPCGSSTSKGNGGSPSAGRGRGGVRDLRGSRGSRDLRHRKTAYVTICVGGNTLCVDEYDTDYHGQAIYTCGACP